MKVGSAVGVRCPIASDLFNTAIFMSRPKALQQPKWPPGFLALAINPLFAPALLTVGSSEYQHGFVEKAMELFLAITKLPGTEEDLAEIIDKAGNFLLEQGDYKNALEFYLSAFWRQATSRKQKSCSENQSACRRRNIKLPGTI